MMPICKGEEQKWQYYFKDQYMAEYNDITIDSRVLTGAI